MAEGEKEIVAGMMVTAELDLSTADAMQKLGDVKVEAKVIPATIKVTADQVAVGDVSDSMKKAMADATHNLKFDFSGVLKANSDIRTLEDSLRSMMTVSDKAGQQLKAVFTTGSKGGPIAKITAKEDIAVALESVQRHMAEFPKAPMKLAVSGLAQDQANYSAAAGAFAGITEAAPDKELQREREANIREEANRRKQAADLNRASLTSDVNERAAQEKQEAAAQKAAAKQEADLNRARLTDEAKEQEERAAASGPTSPFNRGFNKETSRQQKELEAQNKVETEANIKQDENDRRATEAAAESAKQLRFSFAAIGKAEDLQAGLRTVQAQLERIVETSGEINMSFGGQMMTLKGKHDVGQFIDRLPEYAGVTATKGTDVKLGISGVTENGKEQLSAARAVREFADTTRKGGKTLAEMIKDFGQGQAPRRSIASMITSGMQGMGMGDTAASLMGGIGGTLLGSMFFRLGWGAMEQLQKIPEAILNVIEANQNIDVARSRAAATPLGTLGPPTLTPVIDRSDKKLMAIRGLGGLIFNRLDMGKGTAGKDFTDALDMTVTEFMGTITDPKKREAELDRLTEEAKTAEFGVLGAGMQESPTQIARAFAGLRINQDPKAAGTLLNLTGVERFMVEAKKEDIKKGKIGLGFYPGQGDAAIWEVITEQLVGKKGKLNMPDPATRQEGVNTVLSAVEHVIANNQNVAALESKMASTQFMKYVGESWAGIWPGWTGPKDHLSLNEQFLFKQVQAYKKGINPATIIDYTESIADVLSPSRNRATAHLNKEWETADKRKVLDWMGTRAGLTGEEIRKLVPSGTLDEPDTDFFLGKPKPPTPYANEPFLQMKSSTQSIEGLRQKMQDMDGIQINMAPGATQQEYESAIQKAPDAVGDTAQQTVAAIGETNKKLQTIIDKMGGAPTPDTPHPVSNVGSLRPMR